MHVSSICVFSSGKGFTFVNDDVSDIVCAGPKHSIYAQSCVFPAREDHQQGKNWVRHLLDKISLLNA